MFVYFLTIKIDRPGSVWLLPPVVSYSVPVHKYLDNHDFPLTFQAVV